MCSGVLGRACKAIPRLDAQADARRAYRPERHGASRKVAACAAKKHWGNAEGEGVGWHRGRAPGHKPAHVGTSFT
jgi:hypothetical protein